MIIDRSQELDKNCQNEDVFLRMQFDKKLEGEELELASESPLTLLVHRTMIY